MEIFKFYPIHKPTLWGSETWIVSAVKGDESIVSEGSYKGMTLTNMVNRFGESLIGKANLQRFGTEFPLLIKMIDAQQDLSIQVHPDDKLAAERHGKMGKNEMWYIVDADHGSQLFAGFKRHLDKKDYAQKIADGSIEEDLCKVDVAPGDCIYIPAGRVHSIGAGMTIAEIQQTSDVTYRIYDFMRKDANGNTRELHTELAQDAIDFNDIVSEPKTTYKDKRNELVPLVESPYFNTQKLTLTSQFSRTFEEDSFHAYICIEGSCCFIDPSGKGTFLHQGEALVVPANMPQVTIIPEKMHRLLDCCVI